MFELEIIDNSHLNVLIDQIDHLSHLLPEIGDIMMSSVQANFRDEGRPAPWAQRIPPTGSWPILFKSGSLYHSLNTTIEPEEISLTHATEYGDYLDEGTSKMLARPFLLFQEDDINKIEELIAKAIGR